MDIPERISEEHGHGISEVRNAIALLEDGNTVPFIARYRKENTGDMDEVELRELKERLEYLKELKKRKKFVKKKIEEQDKLTEDLEKKIKDAKNLRKVNDLYRPYKKKRKTRAGKAREKGLEPLAEILMKGSDDSSLRKTAEKFVDSEEGIENVDDALQGARDIIAEDIAHSPDSRDIARGVMDRTGRIVSKMRKESDENFENYDGFEKRLDRVKPHQILAINRGENEKSLSVKIRADRDEMKKKLFDIFIEEDAFKDQVRTAIEDGLKRLLYPAVEREFRSDLTERAEEHAVEVFSENLENLLLKSPVTGKRILAVDPAFRSGCKLAVLDEHGSLLETGKINPHSGEKGRKSSKKELEKIIENHSINAVCIGNGTASRETEELVSEITKDRESTSYTIVDEAGASVYSASEVAREEFPELDVSMRGAVSIGRRLQDPLAELVKIPSESIGVGMYQHDIDEKKLERSLGNVVESAVNFVGADINQASRSLLEYVSGVSSGNAESIVEYREENGKFRNRDELKDVGGIGPKTFKQAAGFLMVREGDEFFDRTRIHPESYRSAEKLISELGFEKEELLNGIPETLKKELREADIESVAEKIDKGIPTLRDIRDYLLRPGRDPREDMPEPVFRDDVLKMEDLEEGMKVTGTVRNVVDFGAFVDIGVKEDGLVHISEMSDGYVDSPMDVVAAGENVEVTVKSIDTDRGRISLSMVG